LSPQPFELGALLAAENAAAVDWVGAFLLNLDPAKIPLLAGVFGHYRWPLARFAPESITVTGNNRVGSIDNMLAETHFPVPKHVPPGWTSAVRSAGDGANDSIAAQIPG